MAPVLAVVGLGLFAIAMALATYSGRTVRGGPDTIVGRPAAPLAGGVGLVAVGASIALDEGSVVGVLTGWLGFASLIASGLIGWLGAPRWARPSWQRDEERTP